MILRNQPKTIRSVTLRWTSVEVPSQPYNVCSTFESRIKMKPYLLDVVLLLTSCSSVMTAIPHPPLGFCWWSFCLTLPGFIYLGPEAKSLFTARWGAVQMNTGCLRLYWLCVTWDCRGQRCHFSWIFVNLFWNQILHVNSHNSLFKSPKINHNTIIEQHTENLMYYNICLDDITVVYLIPFQGPPQ